MTVTPEVRLALRVVLRHVEPGWDNCVAVVKQWLTETPKEGRFSRKRYREILKRGKSKRQLITKKGNKP